MKKKARNSRPQSPLRSLSRGQLTTVSGGGGEGNDLLIGGDGVDSSGGAGLDILIGNTGGDRRR